MVLSFSFCREAEVIYLLLSSQRGSGKITRCARKLQRVCKWRRVAATSAYRRRRGARRHGMINALRALCICCGYLRRGAYSGCDACSVWRQRAAPTYQRGACAHAGFAYRATGAQRGVRDIRTRAPFANRLGGAARIAALSVSRLLWLGRHGCASRKRRFVARRRRIRRAPKPYFSGVERQAAVAVCFRKRSAAWFLRRRGRAPRSSAAALATAGGINDIGDDRRIAAAKKSLKYESERNNGEKP